MMRMVLFLCGLPPQIPEPHSNNEENNQKISIERSSKYPYSSRLSSKIVLKIRTPQDCPPQK